MKARRFAGNRGRTFRRRGTFRRLCNYVTAAWGKMMKKLLLAGVSLAAIGLSNAAQAADPCPYGGDPYKNYSCLDPYLGTDFLSRFINYYKLEWGQPSAPADPKAPPSRRPESEVPPTPQSTPPMPFTEWPYGGTTNLGVTRPNSIDSPLMAAMSG